MARTTILVLACILALSACEPVATPAEPAAAPAVTRGAEASNAHGLLNAERARKGLAPVSRSTKLNAAAAGHARNMAARGFFSHTGSNGGSVGHRVGRQGYGYCVVNENLSYGRSRLANVIRAWMNSPGHRRNILNPKVTEFGVAKAPGNYWVLVMARPGC